MWQLEGGAYSDLVLMVQPLLEGNVYLRPDAYYRKYGTICLIQKSQGASQFGCTWKSEPSTH